MYVKNSMQAIIMTVSPNDLISTARNIMRTLLIRHLPVVLDGNRLVGLVTDRDLRQANRLSRTYQTDDTSGDTRFSIRVGEIMTQQVYTVSPDTALIEAANILLEQKFDCLPVVDANGILKGLVTVSDFVRLYVEQQAIAILD